MKQLTSTQQKIVEDNHKLIYGLAHKNHINLDEYYGVLAIGLCKAALSYDEVRGQFSTFAYTTMLNEYNKVVRHNKTNCVIPDEIVCSMDIEVKVDGTDGNAIKFGDLIPDDKVDIENDVISSSMLDSMCNNLSEQDKEIVMMLADGMSQTEIAKFFGVKRQCISQKVIRIREKVNRCIA